LILLRSLFKAEAGGRLASVQNPAQKKNRQEQQKNGSGVKEDFGLARLASIAPPVS